MTQLLSKKNIIITISYILFSTVFLTFQDKINFEFSAAKNLNLILLLFFYILSFFSYFFYKNNTQKNNNSHKESLLYSFLNTYFILIIADILIKYFISSSIIVTTIIFIFLASLFISANIIKTGKLHYNALILLNIFSIAIEGINSHLSYFQIGLLLLTIIMSLQFSTFLLLRNKINLYSCVIGALLAVLIFYFDITNKLYILLPILLFVPINNFDKKLFIKWFKICFALFIAIILSVIFIKNDFLGISFFFPSFTICLLGSCFSLKNNKHGLFLSLFFISLVILFLNKTYKTDGLKVYKTVYSTRNIYEDINIEKMKDNQNLQIYNLVLNNIPKDLELLSKDKKPLISNANPIKAIFTKLDSDAKNWKILQIGMDTGHIICNSKIGQDWTIIDPSKSIIELMHSDSYFSYINKCFPTVRTINQNPRKYLDNHKEKYDAIIIYGMKGSSPNHYLYSYNAIKSYKEHLNENGIIITDVFHPFLNLEKVVLSSSSKLNLNSSIFHNYFSGDRATTSLLGYNLVVLTKNKKTIQKISPNIISNYSKKFIWFDNNFNLIYKMKSLLENKLYSSIKIIR